MQNINCDLINVCPERFNVSASELNACTQYLYGVTTDSFNQSGSDSGSGSFTGSVSGSFDVKINAAYNAVPLASISLWCGPVPGCTPTAQFNGIWSLAQIAGTVNLSTYGLNNINNHQGAASGTSTVVQLTELGNALIAFTGKMTISQMLNQDAQHRPGGSTNNSPGLELYQCVYYGVNFYADFIQ